MEAERSSKYEIVSLLGQGGFGVVYRANERTTGGLTRVVAIKMLRPGAEDDPSHVRRFRDEAQMLVKMRHEGIVRAEDIIRLNGRLAVVMEYVPGATLSEVIGKLHPVAGPSSRSSAEHLVGPVLECVARVADALHYAYAEVPELETRPLELLHRDIKPSNIRLTPSGHLKLLDFGVSRASFAEREAVTSRGEVVGTPGYMSPERLCGSDTHAGDIYALGVLTYRLLTGLRFGETPLDPGLHQRRVSDVATLVQGLGVPLQVVDLLRQMLDFAPGHRPTGEDLADVAHQLRRQFGQVTLRDWAREFVRGDDAFEREQGGRPPALESLGSDSSSPSAHVGSDHADRPSRAVRVAAIVGFASSLVFALLAVPLFAWPSGDLRAGHSSRFSPVPSSSWAPDGAADATVDEPAGEEGSGVVALPTVEQGRRELEVPTGRRPPVPALESNSLPRVETILTKERIVLGDSIQSKCAGVQVMVRWLGGGGGSVELVGHSDATWPRCVPAGVVDARVTFPGVARPMMYRWNLASFDGQAVEVLCDSFETKSCNRPRLP
ncbi:MAG: serine/threonine protein kinase [Myxococcales bacterium]|nr:serine/threonine protein kinase [Myxococcales bacterium]